jgi:hypothetical protein
MGPIFTNVYVGSAAGHVLPDIFFNLTSDSCLAALSRRSTLVSLLFRDKRLLPRCSISTLDSCLAAISRQANLVSLLFTFLGCLRFAPAFMLSFRTG